MKRVGYLHEAANASARLHVSGVNLSILRAIRLDIHDNGACVMALRSAECPGME